MAGFVLIQAVSSVGFGLSICIFEWENEMQDSPKASRQFSAKEEVIVFVRSLCENDEAVIVGRLTEIDQEGLTFLYVPTEENQEVNYKAPCDILIKNYSNKATLSQTGAQISDASLPYESFFKLRSRQCKILFSGKSSLPEIAPFACRPILN
ncbi:MAG: hypothetical protein AB9866_23755 [Syntrophobacteraceae bacterium]